MLKRVRVTVYQARQQDLTGKLEHARNLEAVRRISVTSVLLASIRNLRVRRRLLRNRRLDNAVRVVIHEERDVFLQCTLQIGKPRTVLSHGHDLLN